jgi:lipoprotein-releasing system ATP-binding protein
MTMLLELKEITKKFELPSGKGYADVLKNLFLQVLLNIIGALDKPSSGEVILQGKNLAECDDAELSRIRNREIGFVFQLHHLLPQCTVLENVLIPTIPIGLKKGKTDVQDRAKILLERVGLKDHMSHFPAQLSGGEMQRTAVVRALINKPKLILADEPTGSLDRDSSENLGRLMVEMNIEEGTTLITVTHSLDFAKLMERVLKLQNGILESFVI